MKILWKGIFLWGLVIVASFLSCEASGLPNNGTKSSSSSGVVGPPKDSIRTNKRLSKDLLFRNLNGTGSSNSTFGQPQKRSPSGQVQILESGSRNRGESRVLKRGPPGSSTRFSDSVFTLRNSLKTKQNLRGGSGYDSGYPSGASSLPSSSYESIPLIPIPGNNIPPPVYSYGGSSVPAPPPSSSLGSSSYGDSYGPGGGGGGGGVAIVSTTSLPEIIFPPDEITPTAEPGPLPIIGPGPGTSVPIIGGGGSGGSGGGGGGEILPPSPPPDEIFPPAPPPDEDDFEDDGLGRRLKVTSGRSGSPGGAGGGVRTRTRIVPSQKVVSTRVSSVEAGTPLVSARERVRSSGATLRRDRLRDKVKEFKTTVVEEVEPIEVDELLVNDPNVITDFVFSDIRCFKTRQNEYFGATIHLKSGFHLPYIRDRPQDPLSSEECRLEQLDGARGSYHMSVTDLRGCGVENCGEAMCLTMVFPRVPLLALADDEVTTIKCIPQKSTISDLKSISFAGDSTENRRSSSTVEGGIQEFVAEVGVFRQNPGSTNGLFVKRVNSGGVVQLGEPLQLRSVVRGTDGWKHSKLTDVKVWRMHDNFAHKLDNLDPNQASEVITLVDAQGCRNDEYVVIADDHPLKDPRNDMVHHFTFKAFLFRGQRVNEPLVVTARVHACQEYQDCIMECESGRRRVVKRSPVEINNASAIIHGFDSKLALRVVGLKDHPSSILYDEFPIDQSYIASNGNRSGTEVNDTGNLTCGEKMFATGLGGGCIMLLICGLGLALYTYIKQGRLHAERKSGPGSGLTSRQGPPPAYRYHPPPSARAHTTTPYQKPLPPTPTSQPSATTVNSSPNNNNNNNNNNNEKGMSADISQVAKLLQELAKNNSNEEANHKLKRSSVKSLSRKSDSTNHKNKNEQKAPSEYACIDETNSSSAPSSSSSSSEDLSKRVKKGKDGVYIVYCYNDKKNKVMLPMSAPSSTRMRRKHLMGKSKEAEDYDEEDEDFIDENGNESETQGSQTEDMTEESDEYGEIGGVNNNSGEKKVGILSNSNNNTNVMPAPLAKNQVTRRTVRDVKKKSKQNNCLAFASTRSSAGGIIRRRVSSVYREGYLSGIRGAVVAAVQGSKNGRSDPLKFRRVPSLGNIPSSGGGQHSSGKRINFSVREHRSARKRRDPRDQDLYSSEGMLSTGASDLDSAYSGSNCSKLTEDQLYELKRNNGAGRYPDFRDFQKLQQNLLDVQRQLRNGGAQTQGHHKLEVRRTSSVPENQNLATPVNLGLGSPPLPLGETKATHFVTRDDSTTKILIVPETHV